MSEILTLQSGNGTRECNPALQLTGNISKIHLLTLSTFADMLLAEAFSRRTCVSHFPLSIVSIEKSNRTQQILSATDLDQD